MLAPTVYLQLQLAVQQYHQHEQLLPTSCTATKTRLTNFFLQQQQQKSLAQTTLQQQLLQGWSHQPHDQ